MVRNESSVDRIVRAVVGAVLVIGWVVGWVTGTLAIVLGVVGIVLLVTAAVGFCPLYRLLGISTEAAPQKH